MLLKVLPKESKAPIVLLGGSGSGKTALALEIAREYPCVILSLDSLSVYKEIDIVSAKPSRQELLEIRHFGIDCLCPTQAHNAAFFINTFKEASAFANQNQKTLLIVGGSSFYLKALLRGLSPIPTITQAVREQVDSKMQNLQDAYMLLAQIDKEIKTQLKPTDTYRIAKGLEIYFATHKPPSVYFRENPPVPTIQNAHLFELSIPRENLLGNIQKRTQTMFALGLLAEVEYLAKTYSTQHFWAKSIGIRESLEFLGGDIATQDLLKEQIVTHTMQLAKRQKTFNKTQFPPHIYGNHSLLKEQIVSLLR